MERNRRDWKWSVAREAFYPYSVRVDGNGRRLGRSRYGNVDRQKKNISFCEMPNKQKSFFVVPKGGSAKDMRTGGEGSKGDASKHLP